MITISTVRIGMYYIRHNIKSTQLICILQSRSKSTYIQYLKFN